MKDLTLEEGQEAQPTLCDCCGYQTVRTFDGVGHFLMMEGPRTFNVKLPEELARLGRAALSSRSR